MMLEEQLSNSIVSVYLVCFFIDNFGNAQIFIEYLQPQKVFTVELNNEQKLYITSAKTIFYAKRIETFQTKFIYTPVSYICSSVKGSASARTAKHARFQEVCSSSVNNVGSIQMVKCVTPLLFSIQIICKIVFHVLPVILLVH